MKRDYHHKDYMTVAMVGLYVLTIVGAVLSLLLSGH